MSTPRKGMTKAEAYEAWQAAQQQAKERLMTYLLTGKPETPVTDFEAWWFKRQEVHADG